MSVPFTDVLRLTNNGKIVDALTEALVEVNAAVIAARKSGELTLKVKVVPDATGGRQTKLEFDVTTKTPRPKLPDGVFWMSDNYDLLRSDPDQREMFTDASAPSRAYTPPREVNG